MDENKIQEEDEISLIDLFAVLWRYKVMIIAVTLTAMLGVVIYSVISLKLPAEKSFLPNKYTAQAQMLINDDSGSSGGHASMLSSFGLGGLASMAGVNVLGGASNSSLAGYLVHSNSVLDEVVNKFNLIERYKIEEYVISSSRDSLKAVLVSNFDDKTGVFSISFTDIDPVFAKDVVNFVVSLVESKFLDMGIDKNRLTKENLESNIDNTYKEILKLQKEIQELEYSVSNVYNTSQTKSIVQQEIYAQLKAQYEMLKVTMSSEQPVFQILEYAEVPDRKSGPSRGMLCIIVTFAAGFISIFMAFLLNALKNIKNDPKVMEKLRGNK